MKTRVKVTLVAEKEVEIEVEHKEDEDPTDLSNADVTRALRQAPAFAEWSVDKVMEVTP